MRPTTPRLTIAATLPPCKSPGCLAHLICFQPCYSFAPAVLSKSTMSLWFFSAAYFIAVLLLVSLAAGSAPLSSSSLTTSFRPLSAADINAV